MLFNSLEFILGFLPESRQAMFVMPVLVALTVVAAGRAGVSTRVYVLLAVLAVPMSKGSVSTSQARSGLCSQA